MIKCIERDLQTITVMEFFQILQIKVIKGTRRTLFGKFGQEKDIVINIKIASAYDRLVFSTLLSI